MRHGLDMAFSSNQQQLFNWAGLFGVELPKSPSDLAKSSLKYWVEAHKRIISLEESLGKEKLLVLNYDELCRDPISGIKNITHFLGIDLAQSEFDKISKLPVIPKSSGRYKLYPEINFDPSDIAFVEKMGFNCAYETMLSR